MRLSPTRLPNRGDADSRGSGLPARGLALAVAISALALMIWVPDTASAGKGSPDTVKISGTAYAFFDIDDRIPGAVVRVEEFPGISDAVAPDGSYEIEVPDDVNVTPYIDVPADYRGIYLQTFHTSGQDLEHVNFQVVPTLIYAFLANLLAVPLDESGQIEQCVIVSTFSIHEARDATTFDPGFKDVYPHGLEGSTATIDPVLGSTRGPIYFNESVVPDPMETSSSVDGGVLWAEVPPGYYWLEPSHPTERLAPFLAHCEDGRLVNANPPWGFYELKAGEQPDPAVLASPPDVEVDGSAYARRSQRQRGRRIIVKAKVEAKEDLGAKARGRIKRGKRSYRLKPISKSVASGKKKKLKLRPKKMDAKRVARALKRGKGAKAKLILRLSDDAGNVEREKLSVKLRR
jgi:hypothetical protein